MKSEWKVATNYVAGEIRYMTWRQSRALRPGEPMHSGVMECGGMFKTHEEAQALADKLNAEEADGR